MGLADPRGHCGNTSVRMISDDAQLVRFRRDVVQHADHAAFDIEVPSEQDGTGTLRAVGRCYRSTRL